MKRFFCCLCLVVLVVCLCFCFGVKDKHTYLRIKITANSFSSEDKNIKYEIKDKIMDFLSPYINQSESCDEVYNIINEKISTIICIIDGLLIQNNLDYKCYAKTDNQYFAESNYNGTIVESDFYDTLFINLGEGVGDTLWCFLYPMDLGGEIDYQSRLINPMCSFFIKEKRWKNTLLFWQFVCVLL